jgi:hypothetical protein
MYFYSEGYESDELPDDIECGVTYIAVPHYREIDMGTNLVFVL